MADFNLPWHQVLNRSQHTSCPLCNDLLFVCFHSNRMLSHFLYSWHIDEIHRDKKLVRILKKNTKKWKAFSLGCFHELKMCNYIWRTENMNDFTSHRGKKIPATMRSSFGSFLESCNRTCTIFIILFSIILIPFPVIFQTSR